jgi:hypothetical protein
MRLSGGASDADHRMAGGLTSRMNRLRGNVQKTMLTSSFLATTGLPGYRSATIAACRRLVLSCGSIPNFSAYVTSVSRLKFASFPRMRLLILG